MSFSNDLRVEFRTWDDLMSNLGPGTTEDKPFMTSFRFKKQNNHQSSYLLQELFIAFFFVYGFWYDTEAMFL